MPLHLQYLLGFSTWLVPFMIILSCSLLLAFVLVNCGARVRVQIHIESHSNVNLCPVFYLKAYLRHTESFRKKPDGS